MIQRSWVQSQLGAIFDEFFCCSSLCKDLSESDRKRVSWKIRLVWNYVKYYSVNTNVVQTQLVNPLLKIRDLNLRMAGPTLLVVPFKYLSLQLTCIISHSTYSWQESSIKFSKIILNNFVADDSQWIKNDNFPKVYNNCAIILLLTCVIYKVRILHTTGNLNRFQWWQQPGVAWCSLLFLGPTTALNDLPPLQFERIIQASKKVRMKNLSNFEQYKYFCLNFLLNHTLSIVCQWKKYQIDFK